MGIFEESRKQEFITLYKELQKGKIGKKLLPSTGVIYRMFTLFRTIKPLYNKEGKVSPSAILDKINADNDQNLISAILIQANHYPSAYANFIGGQKACVSICSLIPYIMCCMKWEFGVMYEEWDKTDSKMSIFLGKALSGILTLDDAVLDEIQSISKEEILELRQLSMIIKATGKQVSPLAYNSVYIDELRWFNRLSTALRHILMQSWLANSTYRTEEMILDFNDWDKMPESIDESYPKSPQNTMFSEYAL